ncbi:MAG: SRPBCC domain-containing protein, partial [Protaetiibacter sp.]
MTLTPIRRHLVVRADPDRAYRVFTEQLGTWWPLARHSVYERDNSVAFEGDEIVERSASGASNVWGRVTDADPPHRIAFTWHPGREEPRGAVEVTFVPIGEGLTLVTLVHSGWESYGGSARAARDEYRGGWPTVLAAFGADA